MPRNSTDFHIYLDRPKHQRRIENIKLHFVRKNFTSRQFYLLLIYLRLRFARAILLNLLFRSAVMNTNSPIEISAVSKLDSRVDDVSERLSYIEGQIEAKQKKSFFERLGTIGGIFALFISILTGGYTLYDNFIDKPKREKLVKLENVRSTLNQIAEINTVVAKAQIEPTPANAAVATAQMSKLIPLMTKAHNLYKEYPGVFNFADHMMMGNLLLNFRYFREAHVHADESEQLAVTHIEKANYYWLKAKIFGAIGELQNLDEMRRFFQTAIDVSKSKDLQISIGTTFQIYSNWLLAELNTGKCPVAKIIFEKLSSDLKLRDVFVQTRAFVKNDVSRVISASKRNCDLDVMALD